MPILFENIAEKIEFNIQCILKNQKKVINGKVKFKFQEWLSLDPNFRFYATTKLSKPHYSPEICVIATLLNF